ncbi:MAG: hypothetical protein H2076_02655 [Planctomycetes bacterium]|nr:hypothetical protein [Planctomycetota bacterium]
MLFRMCLVLTLLFSHGGVSIAQDASFNAASGTAPEGGTGTLSMTMDNTGQEIAGWSLGVCNDPAVATVSAANSGADTETAKNGSAPDFNQIGVFPEGATQGVVLCFTGCAVVTDVSGFEMMTVDYQGVAEGQTSIAFCNTLGAPPVDTVIVVNGASLAPTQNAGTLDVVGVPDPEYTYSAGSVAASYNPADGNASATVGISIAETDNSGLGAPFPNATQGFSMGLANSAEVSPTNVTLDLGFDPDFGEIGLFADGWTAGVVYSFTGGVTANFENATEVISVDYETAGSMAGNETGATATLTWSDDLGSPPVANVMVVGGASLNAAFEDGAIALNPVVTLDFIRGDANADAKVNIADGVWIIYELFLNGPASTCTLASDANADGLADIADASFIFMYRFMNGMMPSAPFPDCGQVVDQTPEDCVSSGCADGGGSAPATFVADIQPILTSSCVPCHAPGGAQGNGPSFGLQLTEDAYDNIVGMPAGQCDTMNLVNPGDRNGSWLYRKIQGSHLDPDVLDMGCCPDTDGDGSPDGCGRRMPRFCENSNSCMDEATIELIGSWIDAGAF